MNAQANGSHLGDRGVRGGRSSLASTLAGLSVGIAGLVACPQAEEGSGEGADSTGGAGLPNGVYIDCCYIVEFDADVETPYGLGEHHWIVCEDKPGVCLDPDFYTEDPAGLYVFCAERCDVDPEAWPQDPPTPPSWTWWERGSGQLVDGTGEKPLLAVNENWLGCEPVPVDDASGLESHVHNEGPLMPSCDPGDDPIPPDYPPADDVAPPTHGAFFAGRDGSMDIEIVGYQLTAEYNLALQFALANCADGGIDGGWCELVLSGFEMSIHDIEMLGSELDYSLGAEIHLVEPVSAIVSFDACVDDACVGQFEFSGAEENGISLNLGWTQVNNDSHVTAVAALRLSNDGASLGGVDALYGELQLDEAGNVGHLVLSGSGEDSFGGAFASAEFALFGFVAARDPDPVNCCSEHSGSGCENDYIKACVCVYDTSCCSPSYGAEWHSGCVSSVELLECGVCGE